MAQHSGKSRHKRHEDADGCDIDFTEDPTGDAELPPASGGVQQAAARAGETHAHAHDDDGCDVDFADAMPTKDEELPAAAGGVA